LLILSSLQVSIFDCSNGDYVIYTDYDLPVINLLNQKIKTSSDRLNIIYNPSAGDSIWTNAIDASGGLRPFVYNIHLPGTDSFGSGSFSVDIIADMLYQPVAFGADTLKGFLTCFGEPGTFSYAQTRPKVNGTITFKGITESVEGTLGHLDRQWFPLTPLFYSPTGRQRSHEWRQVNLDNCFDLPIWRQFDRTNNNVMIETTGTTAFGNGSVPTWTNGMPNDLSVEYIRYAKFPRSPNINTLLPPPSPNIYIATKHIVRSASLGMEIAGTYVTETPAVNLVIEYFEGPIRWEGTYDGQPVTGTGIFESTFAIYRHWEFVNVLYNSVDHLADSSFSPSRTKVQILQAINGIRQYISSNPLQDNRIAACLYINDSIIPGLQTMNAGDDKRNMLTIAADLNFSLTLALQF